VSLEVDLSDDDDGDLRGNRGSEVVTTRAHGGTDGDSPASVALSGDLRIGKPSSEQRR
jgi:hypothetical protein